MHPNWSVRTLVEPASEPISVAQAKAWLRIDSNDEDSVLTNLIVMARRQIERRTGRCLVEQTLQFKADRFAEKLTLTRAPVATILAVEYLDGEGTTVEIDPANYVISHEDERPTLQASEGASWPSVSCQPGAITVTAVVGYEACPADLCHAVALLVADAYANREGQSKNGNAVEALISTYKTNLVA